MGLIFAKNVEFYLDELMLLLFEEGYWGFPDSAKSYVNRLIAFVEQHTGIITGKMHPTIFNVSGKI